MMRIAAAGLLVLCLAPAQPAFAQVPAPSVQADAPVIKLISAGGEPRRALRYKVPAASASRVNMSMGMSLTMDLAGMGAQTIDVPLVKFGMNIDVKEVAPNGDINFRFSFADAAMEGPNAAPGALEMLNGLAGVGIVSDRGVMRSLDFDAAAMTNPMLKQILSSSGVDKLSAPLDRKSVV